MLICSTGSTAHLCAAAARAGSLSSAITCPGLLAPAHDLRGFELAGESFTGDHQAGRNGQAGHPGQSPAGFAHDATRLDVVGCQGGGRFESISSIESSEQRFIRMCAGAQSFVAAAIKGQAISARITVRWDEPDAWLALARQDSASRAVDLYPLRYINDPPPTCASNRQRTTRKPECTR